MSEENSSVIHERDADDNDNERVEDKSGTWHENLFVNLKLVGTFFKFRY